MNKQTKITYKQTEQTQLVSAEQNSDFPFLKNMHQTKFLTKLNENPSEISKAYET